MAFLIPFTAGNAFYQFSSTLDGVDYLFDVRWNDRDGAWYFDVLTPDLDPIRSGIKLVLGSALGSRTADDRWLGGLLFAVDTSGKGLDATYDDIGTRVLVYWIPPNELS